MIGRYDRVRRFAELKDEGRRRFNAADGSACAVPRNEFDGFEDIYGACAMVSAGKFPRRGVVGCAEFLCERNWRLDVELIVA